MIIDSRLCVFWMSNSPPVQPVLTHRLTVLTKHPARQFPPLHYEVVESFIPIARQLLNEKEGEVALNFAESYVLSKGNLLGHWHSGDLAEMRRNFLEQSDIGEWPNDGTELNVDSVMAVCLGYSPNPEVLERWIRNFHAEQLKIRLASVGVV